MAFPTIPPSWSAPSSCVTSTDIWAIIVYRNPASTQVVFWDLFLGASATTPTGDCLPPSYAISTPYFGKSCPPGYREATASITTVLGQDAKAKVCCPGADFSFSNVGTAGCEVSLDDSLTFIGTFTDHANGEQRVATFSDSTGRRLSAFGITIVSTSSFTPTSTKTLVTSPAGSTSANTSITTSDNAVVGPTTVLVVETVSPTSSSEYLSMSAGEAAAIGPAAGLGTILLLLSSWLMYRRRAKKRLAQKDLKGNIWSTGGLDLNQSETRTSPSAGTSAGGLNLPRRPQEFPLTQPSSFGGWRPPGELPP